MALPLDRDNSVRTKGQTTNELNYEKIFNNCDFDNNCSLFKWTRETNGRSAA